MKNRLPVLLILLLLIASRATAHSVQASRGVPGSAEFGFGAVLYPEGQNVSEALALAEELNLDWLSVPVAWSAVQGAAGTAARFETLDPVMQFALQHKLPVLVNLTNAPTWSRTARGPNPDQTAQFVALLSQRYPAIEAVELFPGANTSLGWGSQPNAQDYINLFKTVDANLKRLGLPVLLIGAGLTPLPTVPTGGDVDDLVYLQTLYQAGAAQVIQVVSIQYTGMTGEPLRPMDGQEHRILRHYEEVRQVMSANQHQNGRIWITRLSPPSGTISTTDSIYLEPNAQSTWLSQAYLQIRAQLYIGAAFLPGLNSPQGTPWETTDRQVISLINAGASHPFRAALRQMIDQNRVGGQAVEQGQPKEGNFGKSRP